MANIIFADRENACLNVPSLKMRQRLQSAPEKNLKESIATKGFHTPLSSGRKAFQSVNKNVSTPAVNPQEKKVLKPQETQVKQASHTKVEEYPEIEKFIPYDPLDFQSYSIPEDVVPIGSCALAGLASFPPAPRLCSLAPEHLAPLPLSPVKMPTRSDYCSELDAFLQTLDELTIELPPEPLAD